MSCWGNATSILAAARAACTATASSLRTKSESSKLAVHTEQEYPLLQHGHRRADLADAVDQEERRQRIDHRDDRARGQPSHDQHGRKKDVQPHRINQSARRVRVDPDYGQQGQHERRRHGKLEDLRGRLLARLLLGPVPRAAAREAREDQDDDEERDLERHARELPAS